MASPLLSSWSARRIGAAALCCVLLALLLPLPTADAATPACGGAGDPVGLSAPGGDAATVAHGGALGAWRFVPGAAATAGSPGQTVAGDGWSTGTLDGIVPAGAWCLTATTTTTVVPGRAEGRVLAAVHAVGAGGSRLLGVARSSELLAAGGAASLALPLALGEVHLREESIRVEWYLTVARHQTRDADAGAVDASSTSLQVGGLALPGPVAPHPLVGPTRARVDDPQDHQLTVTWQPSGDPRVTGYAVRQAPTADGPFTELGVVTGTTLVVRDLENRAPVFLDVVGVAGDPGTGARTPPSNVTSGRALDRTAPDAPGAPTVVTGGTGILRVTWPASVAADLATYRVERAATADGPFEVVARDVTVRAHQDAGLPPGSTWWYRVRAVDDDGLASEPSPAAATTTAPAIPTGLHLAAVGDGVLTIGWDGTSRPLAGYRVERAVDSGAFAPVGGLVTGTTFTDTGLANGTIHRYRVLAEDARGVRSDPSDALSASPRATPAPRPPTFLTVADAGHGATLEWGPSPTTGLAGYQVLRAVDDGAPAALGGVRTGRTLTDRDVAPGTRYEYTVVAVDDDGRRSPPTNGVTFVVQPSAPSGLRVTPAGLSAVALVWSPSGSDVQYELWRAEGSSSPALLARTEATTFEDTGLQLETTYRYFVRAIAAGFRASPASEVVDVTLRDGPPPAPVVTAVDTTEGGSIELRWEPPTAPDVVGWRIERRVAGDARWDVVAEVPQPLRSHRDGGLTDGTRYEYRVVAFDRSGAESPPSAVASAVPNDTTPPPTPSAPTVRVTVGALAVDWEVVPTAVRYEVLRASAPDAEPTLLTTTSLRAIRDADVAPDRTYRYHVVAIDAAGNASTPSAPGSGSFTTSVSPGTVVPVVPGSGRGPVTGPEAGGAAPAPPSPFDPTRPLFPDGREGVAGAGLDRGTGGPGQEPPTTPPGDRSVLAFPPDLGAIRDAVSAGDLPAAVGRMIGEVAGNVPGVARTFSVPLALVAVILLYLMAQGRIDRDAAVLTVEAPAGGDDDDVEFLL